MNRNKLVLDYCPNFNKIVNFEYLEDDHITNRLISVYEDYVFQVDVNDKDELAKVKELDSVLAKYIEDYNFRKEMKHELVNVKVKKDENILEAIVSHILKIFENYVGGSTTSIYLSRWI